MIWCIKTLRTYMVRRNVETKQDSAVILGSFSFVMYFCRRRVEGLKNSLQIPRLSLKRQRKIIENKKNKYNKWKRNTSNAIRAYRGRYWNWKQKLNKKRKGLVNV